MKGRKISSKSSFVSMLSLFQWPQKAPWVADRLEAEVIGVIAEGLRIPAAKIHPFDLFGNDLGVASLDFVDLELAIQEHFSVSVENLLLSEELPRVSDLVAYLRPRLPSGQVSSS